MFIFDRHISGEIIRDMPEYESQGMKYLFNKYASHAEFLKIRLGQGLIFSSTLLHGNVLNDTSQTRMSVNCRFKNLFAPEFDQYESERKFGTFYKLFSLSPVTELALASKERTIGF
jgi:sporadic carbohydrate cluster 2OG-Fe(II) oxygenase